MVPITNKKNGRVKMRFKKWNFVKVETKHGDFLSYAVIRESDPDYTNLTYIPMFIDACIPTCYIKPIKLFKLCGRGRS
jgi:formylmethanofuran dehydrogenase subunit D